PTFSHKTPILKSLNWLKSKQCIEYKITSLTYTVLHHSKPRYLADKLHLRPPGSTRSSSLVTLQPPLVKLQTGKRTFSDAAPYLWNSLPSTLHQPANLSQPGTL